MPGSEFGKLTLLGQKVDTEAPGSVRLERWIKGLEPDAYSVVRWLQETLMVNK